MPNSVGELEVGTLRLPRKLTSSARAKIFGPRKQHVENPYVHGYDCMSVDIMQFLKISSNK